jgi:hypothetical protein
MSLRKAHTLTHLAFHEIHVRFGVAVIFLMPRKGIFLTSRQPHFFLPLGFLVFGAALSCERVFKTELPVLSDSIAMTGSALVPRRVIVPPDGPLTVKTPSPFRAVTLP